MKHSRILSLITVLSLCVAISACTNQSQSETSVSTSKVAVSGTVIQSPQSTLSSEQPIGGSNILIKSAWRRISMCSTLW